MNYTIIVATAIGLGLGFALTPLSFWLVDMWMAKHFKGASE